MMIAVCCLVLLAGQEVNQEEAKSRVLPPGKSVSIETKDVAWREALKAVEEKSGVKSNWFKIRLGNTLTFSVKNMPPLQAFDQICRTNENILYRFEHHRGWNKDSMELFKKGPLLNWLFGSFADIPAVYVRQYRIGINRIHLQRKTEFKKPVLSASLRVGITWTPDMKPQALRSLELDSVRDDQGNSLLPPAEKKNSVFKWVDRMKGYDCTTAANDFTILYPDRNARSLSVVTGKAVLRYPLESRDLVFDNPAETVGSVKKCMGIDVTLVKFNAADDKVTVVLKLSGLDKFERPKDPYDEKLKAPSDDTLPFQIENVDAIGGEGTPLISLRPKQSGWKEKTFTLSYQNPSKKEVKSLRIPYAVKFFYDEVPFAFKDVPLP